MLIDTFTAGSTATEYVDLPLWNRSVEIMWQSGSVQTYKVRRRDQIRCALMHRLAPSELSWGRFANWALLENECHGLASLA